MAVSTLCQFPLHAFLMCIGKTLPPAYTFLFNTITITITAIITGILITQ
jgi:hypothetical protein